jgi:TM2 domain-containing membrane protein YozV
VGSSRGVNACWLLAMINLLFGWTIVGWLFCLLWAVVGQTKAADAFYRANGRA